MTKGIALLEHINLAIEASGDVTTATGRFYLDVLGCARDPRLDWMVHANVGLGQFHLLPNQPGNQRINGEIALFFSNLDDLVARVRDHGHKLEVNVGDMAPGSISSWNFAQATYVYRHLVLHDPSGNRIVCFQSPQGYVDQSRALGAHPGAAAHGDGLAYIKFLVRPGAARGIGAFYEQLLGAEVTTQSVVATPALQSSSVTCGPLQQLIFEETSALLHPYDGHHICIYVHDFEGSYKACAAKQLVWTNPIFEDKCDSWEETQKWDQYRILHIVDPATNERLLELEHEIRPLHHSRCPLK
ncbi:hypothetical protein ACHHYP_05033 [Achlya hypogyna]|uniref:VOC domain-containing protein n=1 Tax=Achlya hypogyna TaxID=1202772 RepID=A0A1V9YZ20_ACHHY|nr:hypothetical protein ACHHYP_05033 [Achlya hypogyna]